MTPSHQPHPASGGAPVPGRRLAGALAVLLILGLAGCVKNFPNPFDRSAAASESVELYVDNQNFNDVRLFKLGPGGRESVGYVTGRSSETLTVSWRQTSDIRFEIEVLAGPSYRTNAVTASPGDRLQLYIRDSPGNTYLTRR